MALVQLAFTFFFSISKGKTQVCGANQIYKCGGPDCDISCRGLNKNECCINHFAPVNGCFCQKNYAKAKNGTCILISSPQCQSELDDPCDCGDQSCGGRPL